MIEQLQKLIEEYKREHERLSATISQTPKKPMNLTYISIMVAKKTVYGNIISDLERILSEEKVK